MTSRFFTFCAATTLLATGLATPDAHSLSPATPLPESELVAFYEAMDGDNWLQNDGWLDPDVDICDWYGIECETNSLLATFIANVSLPNNNLSGVLIDTDILGVPARGLDLSGNQITGPLVDIPVGINRLDLSRNQLDGPLPTLGLEENHSLTSLNLSSNRFEGLVPEDWAQLELRALDLSNNRLDGGAENAFAALRANGDNWLNLADNRFFGSLNREVANTQLSTTTRSLNLCWNDFVIDDEDLAEWISANHIGGENWEDCLNRDRIPIDLTVSGSWFVPERSGEGVSLQLLEGGGALIYAFSFDLDGNPLWLFEVGKEFDQHLNWDRLWETRGDFGDGLRVFESGPAIRAIGRGLRLDRLEGGAMQFERQFVDARGCPPLEEPPVPDQPILCPVFIQSDRFDNIQLTRLAGTTCDNRISHQWISGAWFDPERNGEGFAIEIIQDGRAVVYWFTYMPDGSGMQAWMVGMGEASVIDSPLQAPADDSPASVIIEVDDLVQPKGGVWGSDFDPEAIDPVHWGSLTFEFQSDSGSGHVYWDSVLEDFGSGDHPLVQATRPRFAECDVGPSE